MYSNKNQSSWTKGEQFENFVQNEIFPESHYELLHKTNDYKQNSQRYVTTSLKPDFQFKCKITGKIFYVEAKFRSKTYKDKYDVLSDNQFKDFPTLNSSESSIFIAFGYGGIASDPDFLSLIPLSAVKAKSISPEEVLQHRIEKEIFPNRKLRLEEKKQQKSEKKGAPNHASSDKSKADYWNPAASQTQEEKKVKTDYRQYYTWASIGLAAILFLFFMLSSTADSSAEIATPDERFKEIVHDYYQSMNSNQIEKLPEFLSPKVEYWYGEENPTQEQIIRNAENHRGKFPYSASEIDWNTLRVMPREKGDFIVSYEMVYKSKQKITDEYTVFGLKLVTEWDENFKLKSIREIRL